MKLSNSQKVIRNGEKGENEIGIEGRNKTFS